MELTRTQEEDFKRMKTKIERRTSLRDQKASITIQSMEFKNQNNASLVKRSIEPSSGRHASESSYAHFFELDKTRNNESMFETSRHDMSISTEIHRPTGGNEEISEHNQAEEDHTGGSVINT